MFEQSRKYKIAQVVAYIGRKKIVFLNKTAACIFPSTNQASGEKHYYRECKMQ